MGKFNWWRRFKTHKPLTKKQAKKGIPFTLQKIQHGDFDISPYYEQMQEELRIGNALEQQIKSRQIGEEAKRDQIRKMWAGQMKRYNKLSEDFLRDENMRLTTFKQTLLDDFGADNDFWDKTVEKCDGNALQFYHVYLNFVRNK